MPTEPTAPVTLAFIGHTDPDHADQAAAYEDAVLPLVERHGGRIVYRGRRRAGEDPSLPFEVHVIWFPSGSAFEAFLADDDRAALLDGFGEVFTSKVVVELDTVRAEAHPPV